MKQRSGQINASLCCRFSSVLFEIEIAVVNWQERERAKHITIRELSSLSSVPWLNRLNWNRFPTEWVGGQGGRGKGSGKEQWKRTQWQRLKLNVFNTAELKHYQFPSSVSQVAQCKEAAVPKFALIKLSSDMQTENNSCSVVLEWAFHRSNRTSTHTHTHTQISSCSGPLSVQTYHYGEEEEEEEEG